MKFNLKSTLTFALLGALFFTSCGVSNKSLMRYQKLEENVSNPTTIEEYKDAIEKYEKRVADIQLAQQQIGIWYKILGTKYLENKMYGEALKSFQTALEYYPDNQNLYYWVGVCAGYMSHEALDYGGSGSTTIQYNYLKLAERVIGYDSLAVMAKVLSYYPEFCQKRILDVKVSTKQTKGLEVPVTAVAYENDKAGVYVLGTDGEYHFTRVLILDEKDGSYAVAEDQFEETQEDGSVKIISSISLYDEIKRDVQ